MKPRAALLVLLAPLLAGCEGEDARLHAGHVEGAPVLVGPEESGRLDRLSVEEGDTVEAGADLFALDARVQEAAVAAAQARLEEAEAALAQSRANFERVERLARQRVSPQARLDEARAAYERDKASVAAAAAARDEARTRLDRRKVAAPATGVVEVVYFRPGEVVSAGQPVVALLPPGALRVRFYVPQPRRASVRLGDRVGVSCDGCPPGLAATVSFISREAEFTPPVIFSREERRKLVYLVEARPEGRTRELTAGQPVTVTLPDRPEALGP